MNATIRRAPRVLRVVALAATAGSLAAQVVVDHTITHSDPFVSSNAVVSETGGGDRIVAAAGGGLFLLEHQLGDPAPDSNYAPPDTRILTQGHVLDVVMDKRYIYAAAGQGGLVVVDRSALGTETIVLQDGPERERVRAVAVVRIRGIDLMVVGTHSVDATGDGGKVFFVRRDTQSILGSIDAGGPVNAVAASIRLTGHSLTVLVGTECAGAAGEASLQRYDLLGFSRDEPILSGSAKWSLQEGAQTIPVHIRDIVIDERPGAKRAYVAAHWNGVYAFELAGGGLARDPDPVWPLKMGKPSGPFGFDVELSFATGLSLAPTAMQLSGEPSLLLAVSYGNFGDEQYLGTCGLPRPCNADFPPPEAAVPGGDPQLDPEVAGVALFRLAPSGGSPLDRHASGNARPYASTRFAQDASTGVAASDLMTNDVSIRIRDADTAFIDTAARWGGFQVLLFDDAVVDPASGERVVEIDGDWDETDGRMALIAHDDVLPVRAPDAAGVERRALYVATERGVAIYDVGADGGPRPEPVYVPSVVGAVQIAAFPNLDDGGQVLATGRLYTGEKRHAGVLDISDPLQPVELPGSIDKGAARGEGIFAAEGLSLLPPAGLADTPRWLYLTNYLGQAQVPTGESVVTGNVQIWDVGTNAAPLAPSASKRVNVVNGQNGYYVHDPLNPVQFGHSVAVKVDAKRQVVYTTFGPSTLVKFPQNPTAKAGVVALEVQAVPGGVTADQTDKVDVFDTPSSESFVPARVTLDTTNPSRWRLFAAWTCGGVAWFEIDPAQPGNLQLVAGRKFEDPLTGEPDALPWHVQPGPVVAGTPYVYVAFLNRGIGVVSLADAASFQLGPIEYERMRFQTISIAPDIFSSDPRRNLFVNQAASGTDRIQFTFP